jgi:hypothetical protein
MQPVYVTPQAATMETATETPEWRSDMAKMIYLADLPSGEIASVIDRAHYDMGERKMPRIYTPETGWVRCTRIVQRKSSPSLHECDARCINATGRTMQCECSCGGKNHGRGRFNCTAEAA